MKEYANVDQENMINFPNAKINLGLRIIEKRPDGYHNLETVFYPIGLKDALEAVPNKQNNTFSLSVSGLGNSAELEITENNLVTKAFRLLESKFNIHALDMHLIKAIPTGAGLGGGSSDAAFTLKLINEINTLDLSKSDLEEFSAHLGADCAFFIKNKPIFASDIGTIFDEITLSLKGYYLVLVKPSIHVSTAEAFSLVKPAKPEFELKEAIGNPVETWKDSIINDFEVSVFDRYPQIRTIKEQMYDNGAIYASMSGSGSSVFGLFSEPLDLKQTFEGCFYWSETLS